MSLHPVLAALRDEAMNTTWRSSVILDGRRYTAIRTGRIGADGSRVYGIRWEVDGKRIAADKLPLSDI